MNEAATVGQEQRVGVQAGESGTGGPSLPSATPAAATPTATGLECLSPPMGAAEVDRFVAALTRALARLTAER